MGQSRTGMPQVPSSVTLPTRRLLPAEGLCAFGRGTNALMHRSSIVILLVITAVYLPESHTRVPADTIVAYISSDA